jgi:hypothetical protein
MCHGAWMGELAKNFPAWVRDVEISLCVEALEFQPCMSGLYDFS